MTRHEKCERLADKLRRTREQISYCVACKWPITVAFGSPAVRSNGTKRRHDITVPEDWWESVWQPGIADAVWDRPNARQLGNDLVLAADPILLPDPAANWRAWNVAVAHRLSQKLTASSNTWRFTLMHFALVEYQGVWVLTPRWEDSLALAQQQFTDALVGDGVAQPI